MEHKKRKNYTLYLRLYGKEIEIKKGTLQELDDFTTCFADKKSMFKNLSNNLTVDGYSFYIKSSKNTRYNVIYYEYRSIVLSENINSFMSKLKSVNKNKLLYFLRTYTDVTTYINTPISDNVPSVRLYKALLTNSDYYSELDSYVKSNYNALRTVIYNIFSEEELADLKKGLDSQKKKQVQESFNDISKKIYEVYLMNKNGEDDYFNEEKYSEEERAFDILNNPLLSTEEKIIELDILFNDTEKYSEFVSKYVYSKGNNNGKTYR